MEDDQRLNTLVHEGDALRFSIARSLKITVDWIFVLDCKKPQNCTSNFNFGGHAPSPPSRCGHTSFGLTSINLAIAPYNGSKRCQGLIEP